ncbi:hypothetical protein [Rheinheimera salexigens]|uniref:DUF4328 domain-containing protein n=1 Tax=Rheinheimera salexigens TaxID=1628148 RepID=A0A1E7Q7Y6_9GAMM|nr:hypothetical protein [Rheinheimera salexigens]OEY70211.1 hypothetical protein BI198_12030 [Rheinheimera salexigens]
MTDSPIESFWLGDLFLILLVSTILSWLVFAQFSMHPIEKKMRANNKDKISKWDGPGWRAIWYAWAIFLPICKINDSRDPLLDPVEVKKHVSRKDWLLAAWFFISIYGMVISGLIASYLWKR